MLYPSASETRETKNISGIWKFQIDPDRDGFEKEWFASGLTDPIFMPVPASFNDITQDEAVRDHIGWVWYEYEDYIPDSWRDRNVLLRFDAVAHRAEVFLNGRPVGKNTGGFLPFEFPVSALLQWGKRNRISVAVNNVLDWEILPPGEMVISGEKEYPPGRKIQNYHFDFFNYAGIHRPVRWIVTPQDHLTRIRLSAGFADGRGLLEYQAEASGKGGIGARLTDKNGNEIARFSGAGVNAAVPGIIPWNPGAPSLYTLEFTLTQGKTVADVYRLPVGFRSVTVKDEQLFINDRPFYFKGFGKHEDMDIRGRAFDEAVLVKDFNLLQWIGANSFRTSHYPYSEETLQMADESGYAVIDECPAVGLINWALQGTDKVTFIEEKAGEKLLRHHQEVMERLIERDGHHPSVVLWSLANEAPTYETGAEDYFQKIAAFTRQCDSTRPLMIVENSRPDETKAAGFFDVIGVNRYNSWYDDPGRLDVIGPQLMADLHGWHERFGKPIVLTEFGADAVSGLHADPPVMFSEEYQACMIEEFQKVIDRCPFVIGEHIWNFADFMTKQDVRRVIGNRKGVFTRCRQPKMAAHLLRKRWRGQDSG